MKSLIFASCAALVAFGTAVAAQDQEQAPRAESRSQAQMRAEHLFDRLDVNHDGRLDQQDRAAHVNAMFDDIDTNHDGKISREEFLAAHSSGMGGEDAGPSDGPRGGEGRGGRIVMMILAQADPAHTGVVTRAAFVSAALALFDQQDANHDGMVTPEERRAYEHGMHQQMRGPGQGGGDMMPPDAAPVGQP